MFVAAIGSLLFVLLYFYLYYNRETLNPPLLTSWVFPIAFYIGVPFFGFGFVYFSYRLLSPKPAVIISDEGIFDNSSMVSAGMLKWEEISYIFTYDFMGQHFLGIVPVESEAVIGRLPYFKRFFLSMNELWGTPPISISETILPVSVDELLEQISEYLR